MMQEFRMSRGMKILRALYLGFFILGLLGSVALPFVIPNGHRLLLIMFVCGIVYTFPVWHFWGVFKRAQEVYRADDSGITRISPDGTQFGLLWSGITAVKPREKLQRLDLYDSSARPVIRLEYQLPSFELLRSLIYEKTAALYEHDSGKNVFYKGKGYYVSMAVVTLFPLGIGLAVSQRAIAAGVIFFGAIGLALAFSVLKETRRVVIKPQCLAISSFLSSRELPWGSIRQIDLKNVRDGEGNSAAVVSVALEDGSQIGLAGFADGSLVLYHALHKAWSTHRA